MTQELPSVRIVDPPVALPPGISLGPLAPRGTVNGPCYFRGASIPLHAENAFRIIWKTHKAEFLRRGFTIRNMDGKWVISQWLAGSPGKFTLTFIGAEKLRDLEGLGAGAPATMADTPAELVLPPLPNGLEDKLLPWQKMPARQLLRALVNGKAEWGHSGAWDCSALGCHAKGQLILMADGTLRKVEDIVVGDSVMGWQGPQTVTELKRGRDTMARIVPIKGAPFVVNMHHILTLQCSPTGRPNGKGDISGQFIDISVADYLAFNIHWKPNLKLVRGTADWPTADLPIDPYFLGVILGDGCTRTHCVSICNPDSEIRAYLEEHALKLGARLVLVDAVDRCPSFFFRGCPGLNQTLRDMNLWHILSHEKHVPQAYKSADRSQRLEMLAGLIDADGHLSCSGYDFISKSQQLAEDCAFLCRSVGLAAYVKPCTKTCGNTGLSGTYYRVSISGDCSVIPCKIARKQAPGRKQKKSPLRTGFSIELLPEDDFYGFSLSGDGRFLLGDFTITHNTGKTFQALAAAIATGKMVGVVCPKSVIGSIRAKSGWLYAFAHFGQHPGFVINYELLRTGRTPFLRRVDKKRFEWQLDPEDYMLIWDEAHNCKNASLNRSMCFAATRKGFSQLFLSGTMAATPLNLGATGVPVGLHNGTRAGYEAFLAGHGCYKKGYGFEFDRRGAAHHLAKIHRTVFPFRGARTRIEDLGDAFPETQVICEAVETDATSEIAAAFDAAQDTIDRLEKQGRSEGELKMLGQAAYMKAWHESEKAKIPTIVSVVKEELEEGRSVALFVNFTDVRERIMAALKTRCAVFGGQNIQHRNGCIEEFQAGRSRVIVCNLAAGGVGVSLHDTTGEFPRTAIILPNNDAVKLGQALGRVHRAGGKSRSRQLILFAKDTLEEGICNNVRSKLSAMQSLNDGDLNPQPQF